MKQMSCILPLAVLVAVLAPPVAADDGPLPGCNYDPNAYPPVVACQAVADQGFVCGLFVGPWYGAGCVITGQDCVQVQWGIHTRLLIVGGNHGCAAAVAVNIPPTS